MIAQRNFNIAAFNTDPTVPAVHNKRGLYSDIFQHELSAAAQRLAASSSHKTPTPDLKWSAYNVVLGEYPPNPAELDAIRAAVMEREGLLAGVFGMLRALPRRVLMVLKLNDLTRCVSQYTTAHTRA